VVTGSTNINIAFEAARQEMSTAVNPRDRQFVIFFSDGAPQGTDQMGLVSDYFMQGTNVPTTFTVFFTPNATAPASLQTMTANIQNNGYSTTNPNSALWTIQTSYNALLQLFMEHVIPTIVVGRP
jgi:hypothetical protein